MDLANLVPIPVLLPLLAAGITLILARHPAWQKIVSGTTLGLVAVFALVLCLAADAQGPIVLWVGAWPDGLGIVLVADRLSSLMVLVSSIVTAIVVIFPSRRDVSDSADGAPVSVFHPTFLVLTAGVSNAFLAGDLFNLFVGFEILLFSSYVLIMLGATRERVRAGSTYVVVSVLSSTLFLLAISLVYGATGTVSFAQLPERLAALDPGLQLVIQLLLLVVFGIKAAIFPLQAWLPDSYPTAPASVTAVFAGLLTKVGVFAIMRMQTLLFPDSPLTDLLLVVAILTMLLGILGALAQGEIKRLLSFTLVSHIGYMLLGIALGSEAGLGASIFYIVHHILVQTALFIVVGLIERVGGSTSLARLGGLASVPLLAVLYLVPALNLGGIPPFSGFLGKVALMDAALATETPLALLAVIAGVATSLLTLIAVIRVWQRAFWQDRGEDDDRVHSLRVLPRIWVVAASALVGITVLLTVIAGPLTDFAYRAAVDIQGGAYTVAVEEALP
ncbi:multisubunit sodium/proton antiporter, MrpD subunit [Agrococcus baldri]|uniref:Multisubunit sodium/proton antiporter, MrpD subunit n=1 Tax=Agrococcus baldri TaxID=153730 RepID=A0AA94L045_9MICO|nr:Na+/H+ antiporter subunit D [Agrococcus baldri]SFS15269.1 multisubunit sodium/proton antiporter, MrpD subunit [Agrococcus baldri]